MNKIFITKHFLIFGHGFFRSVPFFAANLFWNCTTTHNTTQIISFAGNLICCVNVHHHGFITKIFKLAFNRGYFFWVISCTINNNTFATSKGQSLLFSGYILSTTTSQISFCLLILRHFHIKPLLIHKMFKSIIGVYFC